MTQLPIKNTLKHIPFHLLLMLVIPLIYWQIWDYPFIQDDWQLLYFFKNTKIITILQSFFSFQGEFFYRPLGDLYFFLMYKLFGLNTTPYHLIALVIHFLNANLVVSILKSMFDNNHVAWGSAFLYAGATSLHLDSLLWVVGIYDLGGTFFFLLSVWLFLKNHSTISSLTYLLGLLFKESTVILPVLLITYLIYQKEMVNIHTGFNKNKAKLAPYLIPLSIYIFIKTNGVSPLSLSADNPYAMRLWGDHLLSNIRLYRLWAFQAIVPFATSTNVAYIGVGLASVALIANWLTGRIPFKSSILPKLKSLVFLMIWVAIGLTPALFLVNHHFRYYFTRSLPAFAAIILLLLDILLDLFKCKIATKIDVTMLVVGLCLLSSGYTFQQINQEGLFQQTLIDGTNALIRRGTIVKTVQVDLLHTQPSIPHNSIIIFDGIDIWSFGKDNGPRLWYNDNTVMVFDAMYLKTDTNGLYILNHPENQIQLYTGGSEKKIYLDITKTFYYKLGTGFITLPEKVNETTTH